MSPSRAGTQPDTQRLPAGVLAGVALAHAALLAALLQMPRAAGLISLPRPLMVSLIEPAIEAPRPEPVPQPSRPVAKPLPPAAVLAAERPLPTPQTVIEAPEPAHEPVPEKLPATAPVAVMPRPAAPPPTAPRPADYLNNPRPPYPPLSRRLAEQGTVRLSILVNPDGSVARLELLKSSGHPRLDQSAIETVQSSWKFEPARQGGNPVAAWVIVPIQFTLRS
ncbi:MAG: energy transducer TonB [Leptothrix sp. (in: Bacteria)]|nr:energy transducer TonB [Leptothrix sp. (in: b-proteobacteria)]